MVTYCVIGYLFLLGKKKLVWSHISETMAHLWRQRGRNRRKPGWKSFKKKQNRDIQHCCMFRGFRAVFTGFSLPNFKQRTAQMSVSDFPSIFLSVPDLILMNLSPCSNRVTCQLRQVSLSILCSTTDPPIPLNPIMFSIPFFWISANFFSFCRTRRYFSLSIYIYIGRERNTYVYPIR